MAFSLTIQKRTAPGKPASKGFPITVTLPSASSTLSEVKKQIASSSRKLTVERQRITTEDKKPLLDDDASLYSLGVSSGSNLYVKDLGPQIGWKTVFLTEYAGPIFIHPLFYYFGPQIWRQEFVPSKMQTVALSLAVAHYVKRELETLFIHRFSNGTMPLFNIFKNSTHYWFLSGFLLAPFIHSPWFSASAVAGTIQGSDKFIYGSAAVMVLAELSNAYTHIILKNLRPAGTKVRKIPRGFAFELVSCPNYFFEFVAWAAFTVLTLNPASALFAAVSTAQMFVWAIKKHKNYKKEYGKEYPRRKAMFPFIA
ncbi:related to TSC13 - Enoyl reductase involved in very long chain fatty acid elongation [Melanopsichium pennsylvanicum]|uniref:very-long-chain enoyl-CoA reductase n=2 Tax=Melanopsichium pennsylvanicum TaxID=63383 RepID=A0AAJ5C6P6_9BASI|nr:related to TSC13-Enoyl reductase involved in very long chain fatty acid elongation [Melanopsichium pennsylvanicum 4]SNX86056.1 related to TSC13 - Enoyl reductase involved in very long chain fatty acid elongation [Melanopsichium pennsylvanicum]